MRACSGRTAARPICAKRPSARSDDARVEPRALAREERDDLLRHDVVVEIDDAPPVHCQTPNTRKPVDTQDARCQVTSSLRAPMAPAPMIQLRSSWSPFASISGLS